MGSLVQSAPEVAPLVDGYEPGNRHRKSILLEVWTREQEGAEPPTMRELGMMLGIKRESAYYHVRTLMDGNLLERDKGRLRLTQCARDTLDLLRDA